MVGHRDEQYYSHDSNDEFLSVDKLAAKDIAHEAESNLTDDVTDVGGGVDGSMEEERVWGL